jgi:hypothetical protein
MTDVAIDELGPVDYLVVEFPAGRSTFTGEMAAELARLSSSSSTNTGSAHAVCRPTPGTFRVRWMDIG